MVGIVNVASVVDGGVDRAVVGPAGPARVVDGEDPPPVPPHAPPAAPRRVTSSVAATAHRRMTTTVGRRLIFR
jgi:hypothetical protein